jgi:RNA polymerase sigma-70 factor (ECF subfamily)
MMIPTMMADPPQNPIRRGRSAGEGSIRVDPTISPFVPGHFFVELLGIRHASRVQTSDETTVDDQALIGRSKRGDREAFGQLVQRHQVAVYRVVRGILADPAESEDVAQEVFVKAFANLARFRGDSGFFTWLYRIAVNEALRVRKRRSFSKVTTQALPEVESPRAEAPAEEAPTLAQLERLLGKLSDEHRAIVVLRDIEEMSYQDIAQTLEVPMGTVESRLFRARQELRALWRKAKEANHAL